MTYNLKKLLLLITEAGTTNVTVLQEERLAVLPGDVIGWYQFFSILFIITL